MRRPQVDKKGRAVSWSFTEVRLDGTLQISVVSDVVSHTVCCVSSKTANLNVVIQTTLLRILFLHPTFSLKVLYRMRGATYINQKQNIFTINDKLVVRSIG